MSIRIVTLADKSYFNYAKALAFTAKQYCPEFIFHIVLVNMSGEYAEILQKINNKSVIQFETHQFSSKNEKCCYCANRRGEILYQLRNKTKDVLVWIDADSLIRRPLSKLLKHAKKFDVSMSISRKGHLMSGLIVVNPTEGGFIFARAYANYLRPRNIWIQWFSAQSILLEFKRTLKKVTYGKLAPTFLDMEFSKSGVIWTLIKSTRNNRRFNKTLKKILRNIEK